MTHEPPSKVKADIFEESAKRMTDEPIRPSEDLLQVFISSRQDPQDEPMSRARALAIEAVDGFPLTKVWAFEDAPASPEAPRDRYIRNAGRADIVIWLIGSSTTTAIVEEVSACMRAQRSLLGFKLPAAKRDDETEALIRKVREYATWKTVENVEDLPAHINAALTDEMLGRSRDPAPVNHDRFLKQKHRESIADTKRLWTTLGVPDEIAGELAGDHSIGHKLQFPSSGTLIVTAQQGSGKTLAAQRLYQLALVNRLQDHLQPFPIFLNARNISGDLKDQIEGDTQEHGTVYTQRVLVIIDCLDETGRYKGNQIIDQVQSYTDANQDVATVVMTRPLPGLKLDPNSTTLPECSDEEFLSLTSMMAGRPVDYSEIPQRISSSKIPLFAVIAGLHLRNYGNSSRSTPSQMVSLLVQRILDESEDYSEETAELLKKLAVSTVASGEPVPKSTVDRRPAVQARLANSRLVVEQDDNFDFAIALFREWFAARALVERTISPSEIDLDTDRWVVPMSIAINSEDERLGPKIMTTLSEKDPSLATLVIREVKHNWSTEDTEETPPSGSAMEIGRRIREAMSNWKEGLGPLFSAIGPTLQDGTIPSLLIDKGPRLVTTSWHQGESQLDPVVEMGETLNLSSARTRQDWPRSHSTEIEPTRVWPWTTTKEELSQSLSEQLKGYRFALDSTLGIRELAAGFAKTIPGTLLSTSDSPKIDELIDIISKWTTSLGANPDDIAFLGSQRYTVYQLTLAQTILSILRRAGYDTISDPWPGPDKPPPKDVSKIWWDELYTDRQVLARAEAIFGGALKIYNDIVDRWFSAFDKRHQMSYRLPIKIEGVLVLGGNPERPERHRVSLMWWPRIVNGDSESGVFFKLGSWDQIRGEATNEMLENAKQEYLEKRGRFTYSTQVFHGNEPGPTTKKAHDWLTSDLQNLGWL